jgi:hypothetical protein
MSRNKKYPLNCLARASAVNIEDTLKFQMRIVSPVLGFEV